MKFKTLLLLSVSCWAVTSCQEKDADQQTAILHSGILGFWKGIIKSTSGDTELIQDISLKLNESQEFTLQHLNSSGLAEGTYDDFPQLQSLTLRVVESAMEDLVKPGAIMDFEYQLYDGELLLTSQSQLLRLKRPDTTLENSGNHRWVCEQGEILWNLHFTDDQFLLYTENKTGASIFLKGRFSTEEEDESVTTGERDIALQVEDGQPVIPFTQLNGTISTIENEATAIALQPVDGQQDFQESLLCALKESP